MRPWVTAVIPSDSPTNGTTCCLPTSNANVSLSLLSAVCEGIAKSHSQLAHTLQCCPPSSDCAEHQAHAPTCDILEQGSGLGHTPHPRLLCAYGYPYRQCGVDIWWLQ